MADDYPGLLGWFISGKAYQQPKSPPTTNANSAGSDGGIVDTFIRNAANGATFQGADALAAAGDATFPFGSWASQAPTWGQRLDQNMNNQYLRSQADVAAHPDASGLGQWSGAALNPVTRYLVQAAPTAPAKILGATIGATLDGTANGMRSRQTTRDQASDTAKNSLGAAAEAFKAILGL